MPDDDIDERLRAVERALTDGETPVRDLSDAAAVHERLDDVDAELADLADRVDALDATVQSLHGYVGELEAVNERVERRADAARAAVERLEDERHNRSTRETEHRHGPEHATDTAHSERENAPDDGESAASPFDAGTALHVSEGEGERENEGEGSGSLLERVRESL